MSPERPLAPKSYCAAVGIFACALLTPYKPSLTTEKKPGSAFCVAKPPKKPFAAESYRGAVGICWVGLACHSRCPNLQAPPLLEQGARRLLDEAMGFGLQIQVFFRNVEARILHRAGACASSWVLSCFQGAKQKETQKSQSIGLFTRQ